jgi:PAS domain S-box-containing protein
MTKNSGIHIQKSRSPETRRAKSGGTKTVLRHENMERLQLAVAAANEAIWDWDLAKGSVKWNNAYSLAFGRRPGTGSSSKWWSDRIHPDDRDRVLATLNAAVNCKDAASWTEEYRFRKADGSWADVHDRALITRDKTGNARRIVGAMLEVTENKRVQEELQRSHEELEKKVRERTDELSKAYELLRRIFAGISIHIAYMDQDFNYINVNRAYAEAEGRTPDFFYGKNHFDLYPDEENRRIFQHVIDIGEPHMEYEKPFLPARDPERGMTYWDWSLQPVKDTDGSVSGLLLTSVDVTNRKHAEENNIRLAAAIESAADAVVISDARGVIQYVNPAFEKITGYSRQDAVGRDQHMLDGGLHDKDFFRDLRETIRRKGFWKGHLINKKKDGARYTEECTYSPIRNNSGEIINYLSIKRDITEKLLLESVAQSVDTMNNIGYIFAGVRHEIGNPVNAVHMILDVLKSKLPHLEKSSIENYLDRALGELSRVEYLLRTLKSYNMYEMPRLQLIRLPDFMNKFLQVAGQDFKDRGISLSCSIEPDAEFCYADPRALQQILLNFLTNASDALAGIENPEIRISARKDGTIRIRVEDNGCGMTEEEQKALFKPFYTTKANGTGLGLVIVKKMLTMMKGTIEISSRKNCGTRVEISLLKDSPDPGAAGNDGKKGLDE